MQKGNTEAGGAGGNLILTPWWYSIAVLCDAKWCLVCIVDVWEHRMRRAVRCSTNKKGWGQLLVVYRGFSHGGR